MTQLRALVIPYHKPIRTSRGLVVFGPGDVKLPADLTRVKLLVEHDRRVVLAAAGLVVDSTEGLILEFPDSGTEECRAAFESAAAGLRDGVSPGVELDAGTENRVRRAGPGVSVAGAGVLREVSLVAIPAADDARVLEVR